MRAVIVEDEAIARQVLENYIKKYCPDVQIIGEAADAKEAVKLIKEKQPDLVFLDVEMPFGNGFDVLESCSEVPFETIFITAYAHYAIKALNMSASYYLLKPLNIDDLIDAVQKVKSSLEDQSQINRNKILLQNLTPPQKDRHQLVLPTLEGFDVVKVEDIIRLQANGNFTDIILVEGKKHMVCRFLKHFEDVLPNHFIRVHRSHIINTQSVTSYHKGNGGYVILSDGSEVDISASHKDSFLAKMK